MSSENRISRSEYVKALNTVRKFKLQKGHYIHKNKSNEDNIMVLNGLGKT